MNNNTNDNNICATKIGYNEYRMCKYCSSIKIDDKGNTYWQCNRYQQRLNENKDNFLIKCKPCADKQ